MLKAKSSKKRIELPLHYHVKKGDMVMVIAGKDKGKTGTITRVFRSKGKVLVEGLNIIKKAVKPNPASGQRGGIIEMEAPLFVSKVMLYDPKNNQPSRAKVVMTEDKAVRVSKKTGEHFDL